MAEMDERIEVVEDDLEERIRYIETIVAVVENEMRSIMADHESFNDILMDLGYDAYADNRQYGDYDEPMQQQKGGGNKKKKK